eukprot:s2135_g3.t1
MMAQNFAGTMPGMMAGMPMMPQVAGMTMPGMGAMVSPMHQGMVPGMMAGMGSMMAGAMMPGAGMHGMMQPHPMAQPHAVLNNNHPFEESESDEEEVAVQTTHQHALPASSSGANGAVVPASMPADASVGDGVVAPHGAVAEPVAPPMNFVPHIPVYNKQDTAAITFEGLAQNQAHRGP